MADQPQGIEALPQEKPAERDPYDLGDTELYPRQEVAPYQKPTLESNPAEGAPPQEQPSVPPKPNYQDEQGRWHDGQTGAFIKAPEPVPAPAVAEHPQWLVQAALDYGIDEDEIASTPTSALTKQVKKFNRLQQKFAEENNLARTLQERPLSVPGTGAGDAHSPAPQSDDLGIDENEIAPAIVTVLKRLQGEVASLRQALGEVKNFQERREHESLTAFADRLFNEHGNKMAVGEGRITDLPDNSAAVRIRNSVIAHARLLAGAKASPRQIVQKIPDALRELGLSAPQVVQGELSKSKNGKTKGQAFAPEEWRAAALQQPTHRSGANEPKGEQRAIQNLEKKMGEAGVGTAVEDSEIMDTLLG